MEPRESLRPGATRSRLKTERAGRPLPQASLSTSLQAPEASRFHTSSGPCKNTRRWHEEGISLSCCLTCSPCNTCFLLMKRGVVQSHRSSLVGALDVLLLCFQPSVLHDIHPSDIFNSDVYPIDLREGHHQLIDRISASTLS